MARFLAALLIVAGLLSFGSSGARAQEIGSAEPLSLVISPSYPKPYETFSVSPRSSVVDLAASRVTISVNGTVVEEGSGQLTGYGRTGAAGSRTTISVVVVNGGKTYRKDAVIRPADVALVLESLATAHPLYEGGALVSSEGAVRLVAVPNIMVGGVTVRPQNLVYTWKLGSQILKEASGIGKSTLTATAPIRYRNAVVSVTVATQDGGIVAYAETTVSPVDPIIRIYRHDPLMGPLYERAYTGTLALGSEEQTFRMVPYFFNAEPEVSWSVNSTKSGVQQDITVRPTGSGRGVAVLGASASLSGLFQSAETSLRVEFGEQGSFNFFGL